MPDKAFDPAELKKKIETIKGQLASQKDRKSPEARKLRKQLKRAQRRLANLTPVALEDRLKRVQKHNERLGAISTEMGKQGKKVQTDAYLHNIRKKIKSFTKRAKKLERLIKKKAPAGASS